MNPIPDGCTYWYEFPGGGCCRLYSATADCLLQGDDCVLFWEDIEALKVLAQDSEFNAGVQQLISEYSEIMTPYA